MATTQTRNEIARSAQGVRIVAARSAMEWNAALLAAPRADLLQSWQWGELKRRQGWSILRLVAVQGTDPRAAVQVQARAVPLAGAFFYAAEGPVMHAEDWAGGDGSTRALSERIDRAAGELADLVAGRPAVRPATGLAGPFGGTPSFEELLRGS